jgi:hypothetical protein
MQTEGYQKQMTQGMALTAIWEYKTASPKSDWPVKYDFWNLVFSYWGHR